MTLAHGTVGEGRSLDKKAGRGKGGDPWVSGGAHRVPRIDILSLIPLVAILALVVLVGALVWAVTRSEAEQARTKLATDALWVEQTLRFQLSVDEDMLVRLALDQAGGAGPEVLEARARLHIATNPEVLSVVWHNGAGRPLRAVPGLTGPQDAALVDRLLQIDAVSSRPVYGDVTGETVTMAMRVAEGGGIVTATVALNLALERHIPWWIAEQYAVTLTDTGDRVLASRARRAPDPVNPTHAISFDPPLRGTLLRITPYDPPTAFGNALLLAAIAGLAAFAVLALLALFLNAQRRRQAEARLRGEIAFRRSMEDSLTVGLRAKDHEGRVLYVNSAFCQLVGFGHDDLVGKAPPMPYWSPDNLEETLHRQKLLSTGGAAPQAFETRFRRRDGTEIDVQVYEAPLIDATGAHRGWMGSVIDITEAKRSVRQARAQDENMARTGRLVTLGEMASTLAHELNQPLSAMASYAAGMLNLLAAGKNDPAVLTPALEKLAVQANRAGQIIRRIQDFVKKREPRFTELSLADLIVETVGFLAADARENRMQIVTDLAPVPVVQADRILMQQVLINLIRNGMEAQIDRPGSALQISLRPGPEGSAVIQVADHGHGIPQELEGRLFDAFASTKPHGMGMGLNICRSIIELHRGQLTHSPRDGGGTIFRVSLPGGIAAEKGAAA